MRFLILLILALICLPSSAVWAQRGRKPSRAMPPKFSGKEFEGAFFTDVRSVLQGDRPSADNPANVAGPAGIQPAMNGAAATGSSSSSDPWNKLISASTIEDAVKNSKLRMEPLVANPTKFAGSFKEVRREYSLQALMFAIIEEYPGDVRWKKSAALARAAFVASPQVAAAKAHQNAKERLQDLSDLLSGNTLEGSAPPKLDWANVIERVPLMQLLGWAQDDYINPHSASKEKFAQNKEELLRAAEMVTVLGKAAMMEGMRDADDPEYMKLARQMVEQALQIAVAVQTDNADMARAAAGQLGQSCTKCHDIYR